MKTAGIIFLLAFILFIPMKSWAGEESPPQWEKLRFSDDNGDGINDLFHDADGDGVNDVTGKPYQHHFTFVDADGDGKNDLFRDADGNGINDLFQITDRGGSNSFRDVDGDGINDSVQQIQGGKGKGMDNRVLDFDEDGVNDVTGKRYAGGMKGLRFIDEDGDGIRDTINGKGKSQENTEQLKSMDRFTDEDGDGINDGRGLGRDLRNNEKNKPLRGNRGKRNR